MTGNSPSNPSGYLLQDYPGFLHDGAGSFCFGDGHTASHRWRDSRTMPPLGIAPVSGTPSPNNVDVAWLQAHATLLALTAE